MLWVQACCAAAGQNIIRSVHSHVQLTCSYAAHLYSSASCRRRVISTPNECTTPGTATCGLATRTVTAATPGCSPSTRPAMRSATASMSCCGGPSTISRMLLQWVQRVGRAGVGWGERRGRLAGLSPAHPCTVYPRRHPAHHRAHTAPAAQCAESCCPRTQPMQPGCRQGVQFTHS